MSIDRITSRPATASDLEAFYGQPMPRAMRAWVMLQDDDPVAVAGYHFAGTNAVVFSDVKDGVPKMTLWRGAKAFMDMLKIPAVCLASEGSGPFLERLGWRLTGATSDGEVYSWQP